MTGQGQTFRVIDVVALMRHASMSATYKPALLKALSRIARRSTDLVLPLDVIGEEFAKMYWNQVVIYHLRQAASVSKQAEVIKLIAQTAEAYGTRNFSDLPESGRSKIRAKMARLLTVNVLQAFHVSKPSAMPPLFQWQKGDVTISLSAESHAFLRANTGVLELIANYYWAEFLEARNRLAPKVIEKVSREGARRGSLLPYLRILSVDEQHACFYCGAHFHGATSPVVDHVIPWSFLLEDPIWDLVLSCGPCNNGKSDWLPDAAYIERLIRRNNDALRRQLEGKASMLFGADDIERLYQAAISLEWPRFWSPGRIPSPVAG